MSPFTRTVGRAFAAVALTLVCVCAGAGVGPEELAALYFRQVDLRLDVPPAEVNAYAVLASTPPAARYVLGGHRTLHGRLLRLLPAAGTLAFTACSKSPALQGTLSAAT